jgi:hypothetical protein
MSRLRLTSVLLILALSGAAALSRFCIPSISSRLQIAAFCFLAVGIEWFIKPELGKKPSVMVALLTCACTAAAILLVRWHTEGLCPHTWPQCTDPIYAVRKSWGV